MWSRNISERTNKMDRTQMIDKNSQHTGYLSLQVL